jgi:hypothetical protein
MFAALIPSAQSRVPFTELAAPREEGRIGQAWPPWFDTCAKTASRLNEAGF